MAKHAICLGCLLWLSLPGCSDPSKDLSSSDPKAKIRAIHQLAAVGNDRAVEQVESVARHEDARVAAEAVVALGRMSSTRACEALQNTMASEQRPEVRKWAAVSLAQRPEPQAAETLRRLVTSDPSPEVRGECALGLGRAGTMDDVNLLARAASAEGDPRAAGSAVTAMETLIGVRFAYDPNAPPATRKADLDRICSEAVRLVKVRKGLLPPDITHTRGR